VKFQSINFTCQNCGAPLRYSPTQQALLCEFCASTKSIEQSDQAIVEYDFQEAVAFLDRHKPKEIRKEVKCNKCAATFELTPYSVSSNCPYCNTPTITNFVREITPQSILPFQINKKEAQKRFQEWIGSLWFAPSALKKITQEEDQLIGYYLPHWTYDAQTTTAYQGQRGIVYYVTVEREVIINGQRQRIQQQEARIDWRPVSGHVRNIFDDITIGASKTISHTILDNLAPWDTTQLVPFEEEYLAGFESEEYTIGLDNGFEYAKIKMEHIIRQTIREDIGGDQQRIDRMQTNYHHTTYKNTLLPIWTAKFNWRGKEYNYAINAQTGKITGERPYSILKISLLITTILLAIGTGIYLDEHPYYLEDLLQIIQNNLG
jgi:Zn finger protein HypA/HybF involved in hydrogenase expression